MLREWIELIREYANRLDITLLLVAFIGFCLAFHLYGWNVLNPTSIDWLLSGDDKASSFIGWHFFRNEPWKFPQGLISGYFAPIGLSIGHTDSIPLLAIPLKLIDSLLPNRFQYFGIWIFLSCVLQGVFGYLLTGLFTRNSVIKVLASLFFLITPLQFFRVEIEHIALSAHWIVLAALWCYFSTRRGFRIHRYYLYWLLTIAISGLVMPYLAVMVMGLAFASFCKEWLLTRNLNAKQMLILLSVSVGLLFFEWWIVGYFSINGLTYRGTGFGEYSMNLNALFNSFGRSRIIPPLAIHSLGQYEGFNYLGLGMFVLMLTLLLRFRSLAGICSAIRINLPLLILCLMYLLFALSNKISWGNQLLFSINLNTEIMKVVSIFRSSGRFFWPVYYLLYLSVIVLLIREFSPKVTIAVLSVGLLIQIADIKLEPQRSWDEPYQTRLKDNAWSALINHFDKVVAVPPFVDSLVNYHDYVDIGYLVGSEGNSMNMGLVDREFGKLVEKQTQKFYKEICSRHLAMDTLFIFSHETFDQYYDACLKKNALCCELDNYFACYSKKIDDISCNGVPAPSRVVAQVPSEPISFVDMIERFREDSTIFLSVRDDAKARLPEVVTRLLKSLGCDKVENLQFQGSYVAVIDRGRMVSESVNNTGKAQLEYNRHDDIVELESAGVKFGDRSIIRIAGVNQSPNRRGINVVVIDHDNRLHRYNYDFYEFSDPKSKEM